MLKLFAHLAIFLLAAAAAAAEDVADFEPLPVGLDAREPSVFATRDGRLLMSWIEASGNSFLVKMAVREGGFWSEPRAVTTSSDLFVNWADFPSIAQFADGTLIAHWLQKSGGSSYAYDIRLALSRDDGETWSEPSVPHRDGQKAQHGFVSLVPLVDQMVAVWLDGRAYDGDLVEAGAMPGQMQLRSAMVSPDGSIGPDIAIDFTTCSCCQTAAAALGEEVLVTYRDRTENEIRDISLTKFSDGRWSAPILVHADNWEISGCPVNGPAIAAQDQRVVVAWFTGAGDVPAVKVAFSEDAGVSFGEAMRIDLGQPTGRVDTLMLDDGTTLVTWVEWQGKAEALLLCRVTTDGCHDTRTLALNAEGNSMNFPKMAATREGLFVAWTQPLPDGRDTIRMLRTVP
ncbi:sialidase family protein [Aestuariicoccus sp. MJ-SS9]|uniref:sialidase family protein n=1 Tax=Aestuariicoccus sp. MJ-SS9 TaxID=3079855 RepID=UPI0029126E64|nr:sialidase family protein [Aestuariicoccus sp. MJ-SS9]MDU8913390.1 sialidase family protein [Aestuariicoccus sp. MJ-SS9]